MLFINISTDYVHISNGSQESFVHRNDVDRELGAELNKYVGSETDVFLLNGPGGFTNLRVGTLCLNLLNSVFKNKFVYKSITKIDLYSFLYQQKQIPELGVIYIGQKNNLRLYDFKNKVCKTIVKDDLKDYIDVAFFDCVFDTEYYPAQAYHNMLKIVFDGKNIKSLYNDKQFTINTQELGILDSYSVEPMYMIDPV